MNEQVVLRRRCEKDTDLLLALFSDSVAAQFALLPQTQRGQLIEQQFNARERQYRQRWPDAFDEIVIVDGAACGRRLWHENEVEIRLIDIALFSTVRGSGIGSGLICDLQQRSDANSKPLRLSVLAGNPAATLYRRLGLVDIGQDGIYLHMEHTPRSG
jgi:ribosomal protein S18 acetylase RimI-like enzyme